VAVDGTSIPHPVPNPLAFVGGGVDEVYTMDVIVESGVGGAVDDLWVGCDDGVGVRVDFSALEQEDLAYLLREHGVGVEGVVDVFVPFGRRVLFVIVLWFDEYVHGFFLVGCVSECARAIEQLLSFGGEGVPGGR